MKLMKVRFTVYLLPDGTKVPDSAFRFQPQDVHGPSELINPARFQWSDQNWSGRPWTEAVLYELHTAPYGGRNRRSRIDKLDHLVELGVTGIEIMPVVDFAGNEIGGGSTALCSRFMLRTVG